MNDIAAIKARREAITPGVWQTYRRHMVGFPADEYVHVECGGELIADCGPADVEQAHADATFIAAAPADIDTLLAEVEWLTGEVERMRLSWAMGLIQLLPPDEKAQAVTKAANAVAALTAKLDAANEEITAMSWDIAGLRYYIHALERYVPEVARRVAAGEARAQLEQQGEAV